jgi:hypothetical protein
VQAKTRSPAPKNATLAAWHRTRTTTWSNSRAMMGPCEARPPSL